MDPTFLYIGNAAPSSPYTGAYIGGSACAGQWAARNGVSGTLQLAYDTVDLTTDVVGSETSRQAYSGAPTNGAVELWTAALEATHNPAWTNVYTIAIAWLDGHPRV